MIGRKLILLDEIDSTNNYTAKLLNDGKMAHGTVILADKQTNGRGQRGNNWFSDAGNQFTCSIYVETAFLSAERYWILNLAVALAVQETIQSLITEKVAIKWPNDLLVTDKKMAGILIETQWRSGTIQGAIIGIGINLNSETTLNSSCALHDFRTEQLKPIDLIPSLLSAMQRNWQRLIAGNWNDIITEYQHQLWKKDESQLVENAAGEKMNGIIRGIDGTGNLLVETNEKIQSYGLKELKFDY